MREGGPLESESFRSIKLTDWWLKLMGINYYDHPFHFSQFNLAADRPTPGSSLRGRCFVYSAPDVLRRNALCVARRCKFPLIK